LADAIIDLASAASQVKRHLSIPPNPSIRPVLVLMCGLPGTGKSTTTQEIVSRVPMVVIRTDEVRKLLFHPPEYSFAESKQVYQVCHALIYDLLIHGNSVVFDGTNLAESHRESVYRISDRAGSKLVIVLTVAPEETVRARLANRVDSNSSGSDRSDADWAVYKKLRSSFETIQRPHLVVDTSQDMLPQVEAIVRQIEGDE
jgi:predicted kinase